MKEIELPENYELFMEINAHNMDAIKVICYNLAMNNEDVMLIPVFGSVDTHRNTIICVKAFKIITKKHIGE